MTTVLRSTANYVLTWRDGLKGWRRGRNEFLRLAGSSREEVEQHVAERLTQILRHAFATVPYYRQMWSERGISTPGALRPDILPTLPFLEKDVIKQRKTALVSGTTRVEDLDVSYTGGTSGTQTSFYRDRACTVARFGRQRGILQLAGYAPGDKRGLVWGASHDLLDPIAERSWKRRFRDFASADAVLCCTVMTAGQMRAYYEELRRFAPKVMYGYPNALEQFARFVKDERLPPVLVEKTFCTAEQLHQSQRQLFREVFGSDVFNLYCCREFGCIAFECSRHDALHIDAGSVVVEVIKDDRAAMPGESGEIVITDLLNYGMPLIRYRTGDTATVATTACDCGHAFPAIASLDGRTTQMLYKPDGSQVAGLILADIVNDYQPIAVIQFVQNDVSSLDVYVILAANASETPDAVQKEVVRQTRVIMGSEIALRVHFVSDVLRNARSGKHEEVVCRIPEANRPARTATRV